MPCSGYVSVWAVALELAFAGIVRDQTVPLRRKGRDNGAYAVCRRWPAGVAGGSAGRCGRRELATFAPAYGQERALHWPWWTVLTAAVANECVGDVAAEGVASVGKAFAASTCPAAKSGRAAVVYAVRDSRRVGKTKVLPTHVWSRGGDGWPVGGVAR